VIPAAGAARQDRERRQGGAAKEAAGHIDVASGWGPWRSTGVPSGEGLRLGVGRDLHAHDAVRVGRRLARGDRVDVLHALDHLAPDRVLAVQVWRLDVVDEELAVGAVRVRGAGHAHGAAYERLVRELGGQVGLVGAAAPGAGWIAG